MSIVNFIEHIYIYIYIFNYSLTQRPLTCFGLFEAVILEIVWIVNCLNVNYLEQDL